MSLSNYPPGALYDPHAPWNQEYAPAEVPEDEDQECIHCGGWVWKMWIDYETPKGFIHRICAEACQNELEEAA